MAKNAKKSTTATKKKATSKSTSSLTRSEITDDDVHEWISFELDGETYTFDATWLMSNWTCIYGNGCLGIEENPAAEAGKGCCVHGAHFTDKADRLRVEEAALHLTDEEWQFRNESIKHGGPTKKEEGDWVTRRVQGACIFLNRPDFHSGAGCALHSASVARNISFLDWKPEVCWQVPIRLDYQTDENDHETNILREWKRRDWGDGGEDFHWWCTEDPRAFVGDKPVYVSSKEEISAMVGEAAYQRIVELLESRPKETYLPHPALKRRPASD